MLSRIWESQCVDAPGLFVMKTSSLCRVAPAVPTWDTRGILCACVDVGFSGHHNDNTHTRSRAHTWTDLRTIALEVKEKSRARVVAGMPDVRDHMEDSNGMDLTKVVAPTPFELTHGVGETERSRTPPLLVARRLPGGTTIASPGAVNTMWPMSASSHIPVWHLCVTV